ncbi:MAG: hypothetical protein K0Q72_984 [Armatimonadetes bacterium]|nr:hypothetical protein [Armatimonadota bacterium]
MTRYLPCLLPLLLLTAVSTASGAGNTDTRPRVIIETDAGGDPDDEQSLVRFLLYANDLDVVGIIPNRLHARPGENLNTERTGMGIVRRQLNAYKECYPNLVKHDSRYPKPEQLWKRTVSGLEDTDEGVKLLIAAVDRPEPRPLWFCNWGTDDESAPSCLKRALDQVLRERGPKGYARFKSRIRLASADKFGDHTETIQPPFSLWVDTFRPELERRRWYHRFSAITATAGGFDIQRDVLTGHGPLGALYPTNTTHKQKEGDTMSFLYLVPTGMNDPEHPEWGSWAGRYGRMETVPDKPYYWANVKDTWEGSTHRENTLKRWAVDLQNDFRTRLEWCVKDFEHANHPPVAKVRGELIRTVRPGETVTLDASGSSDPDRQPLRLNWTFYPEPGTYRGEPPVLSGSGPGVSTFEAPRITAPAELHFILTATDDGAPALTRYRRVIVKVQPRK